MRWLCIILCCVLAIAVGAAEFQSVRKVQFDPICGKVGRYLRLHRWEVGKNGVMTCVHCKKQIKPAKGEKHQPWDKYEAKQISEEPDDK